MCPEGQGLVPRVAFLEVWNLQEVRPTRGIVGPWSPPLPPFSLAHACKLFCSTARSCHDVLPRPETQGGTSRSNEPQ